MDITIATETELKAAAYDQIALMEHAQQNIKLINEELAKRKQQAREIDNV